jgi:DNA-binding NtrC family response regulator
VRQLKNEIQRAVAMSPPGGTIEPSGLSPEIAAGPSVAVTHGRRVPAATDLASAVAQVERDMIQAAIDSSRGNISGAARSLGLTRRGLYLKLRRLGLESRADVETDSQLDVV